MGRDGKEVGQIKTVAIVGMGALGLMYGEHIQKAAGPDRVCFLLDEGRMERYRDYSFSVNGEAVQFSMVSAAKAKPVDLVIVATKYNGLRDAMQVMEKAVDEHTVIISVLNGISSEEILGEQFRKENIVPCVALGMDAMRDGQSLSYCNKGSLRLGIVEEKQRPALEAVTEFFDRISMPYGVEEDIMHAMWGKFMLNVGINQTCMVYDTTYSGALAEDAAREDMFAAMHEVLTIAEAERITLTEEDFAYYVNIIRRLNPQGYPSMRQDALAHRPSEVEMFAGTVCRIAARHGIAVPVNQKYQQIIREREKSYT